MRNSDDSIQTDPLGKKFWVDNFLKENFDFIKPKVSHKIAHRRSDMFVIVDGPVGCLTGDTVIRYNRASLGRSSTIKRMHIQLHNRKTIAKYHQWDLSIPTYVRSFNGNQIQLHKINDVVYSGKKKVYEMILEDGKKIKATGNHKIMTNNGFIELLKIDKEKDLVMCDTLKAESVNKLAFKFRDTYIGKLKYHPYQGKIKRVEVHRLCYEAYLNNLSVDKYCLALMYDKEMSKSLKFIDPSVYAIHHKDGNHYNNGKENLEAMPRDEHYKLHGHYNYKNFNQGIPIYKKVISITEVPGDQDTYDIVCDEPLHNFVANDMVVHNSGKSTLSFQCAKYFDSTFNLSRVVFSVDDFLKTLINAEPGQAVVFDEAIIVNSRSALTDFNKKVIVAMTQIRSKGLYIFFNIPSLFDLDRNLVLNRCHLLLHCYQDSFGDRGKFCVFDKNKMKFLYLKGKRLYTYAYPKANFVASFSEYFYLNRVDYENKKQKEIAKQASSKKEDLFKRRFRVLLKYIYQQCKPELTKAEKLVILSEALGMEYGSLKDLVSRGAAGEKRDKIDAQLADTEAGKDKNLDLHEEDDNEDDNEEEISPTSYSEEETIY